MLVLTRRAGENVILTLADGRQILVRIAEVTHGHKVRLGIDAPADVRVLREELLERPAA